MTKKKRDFSTMWRRIATTTWLQRLRDFVLLTAGALCIAVSTNMFLAPMHIPDGSFLAFGLVARHYFGLSLGVGLLLMRLPGLFLGFRYLGRWRFLIRTGWVALLISAAIDLSAPHLAPLSENPMLNVLYGGLTGGVGAGLIFRGRGSTGGTGVYARILQRFTGWPMSQILLLTDSGILLAGWVFGWESALFGALALFICGLAIDFTLEGPSVVRTVTVVTRHPGEVGDAIVRRFHRGVTTWQARGVYSGQEKSVLFCAISRSEVEALRQLVLEVDPSVFLVVGQAHQARGGVLRDRPAH